MPWFRDTELLEGGYYYYEVTNNLGRLAAGGGRFVKAEGTYLIFSVNGKEVRLDQSRIERIKRLR